MARFGARGALLGAFCGALLAASLGCSPRADVAVASDPTARPAASGSARSYEAPPGGPTAKQLWARTLSADRSIPARVEVVETVFGGGDPAPREVTRFTATEAGGLRPGQPARYRLEYLAPASRAGVILVNDGNTLWRYDPRTHVAARRGSASLAPAPPELEEGVASLPAQADGARPEIESQSERVAGRTTVVLALRRPVSGRMLERRWVDVETGRTLRWEQYSGQNARLARRVEVTQFDLKTDPRLLSLGADALLADFPMGTTLADHRSPRTQRLGEAQAEARRLCLPLHVRGFVLRAAHGASPDGGASTHLLYGGSGGQFISVFVSPVPAANSVTGGQPASIPLTPRANWRPVALDARRNGFSSESGAGSAVAWTDPVGEYYIVVSHIPLTHLLPVAAAFAADRDDAPSSADVTNVSPPPHSWN